MLDIYHRRYILGNGAGANPIPALFDAEAGMSRLPSGSRQRICLRFGKGQAFGDDTASGGGSFHARLALP